MTRPARIIGNPSLAADLLQESFYRLLRANLPAMEPATRRPLACARLQEGESEMTMCDREQELLAALRSRNWTPELRAHFAAAARPLVIAERAAAGAVLFAWSRKEHYVQLRIP